MDEFINRLRWIDLAFFTVVGIVLILFFRFASRAWKKEDEKLGKK